MNNKQNAGNNIDLVLLIYARYRFIQ